MEVSLQRKIVIRTIQKLAQLVGFCFIAISIAVFGLFMGNLLLDDPNLGLFIVGGIVGIFALIKAAYADAKTEIEIERERLIRELKKNG
jgi:hypothetical protein